MLISNRKKKWKKIDGWNYSVNNYGKIRNDKTGRILKPIYDSCGYEGAILHENGKKLRKSIHQFVADAFVGPCPDGLTVNHIDGNKKNNKAWNLEYLTRSDNMKHAYKLGLKKPNGKLNKSYNYGSNNYNAKLNDGIIRKIRKQYKTGMYTQKELAKKFDTTQAQINGIVNYKRWKHVS